MLKSVIAAAFVAGAMIAQVAPASANAAMTGVKAPTAAAQSNVIEVRRGGGGGGGFKSFSGGGGRAFRSGGGGVRSFRSAGAVRAFRGGGHKHHRGHRRHWRGPGIYYTAPLFYGAYSYGYGNCSWLLRKARRTGSRYWWNRYYECRNDYY